MNEGSQNQPEIQNKEKKENVEFLIMENEFHVCLHDSILTHAIPYYRWGKHSGSHLLNSPPYYKQTDCNKKVVRFFFVYISMKFYFIIGAVVIRH